MIVLFDDIDSSKLVKSTDYYTKPNEIKEKNPEPQ